jgi:hypothetical protein
MLRLHHFLFWSSSCTEFPLLEFRLTLSHSDAGGVLDSCWSFQSNCPFQLPITIPAKSPKQIISCSLQPWGAPSKVGTSSAGVIDITSATLLPCTCRDQLFNAQASLGVKPQYENCPWENWQMHMTSHIMPVLQNSPNH